MMYRFCALLMLLLSCRLVLAESPTAVPAAASATTTPTAAPADTRDAPDTPTDEETHHPVVDRIVAVVNTHIITQSELDERTAMITSQLRRQGVQLPDQAILVHQILEKMIMDEVQLQYAREAGIKVDDTQLDQAMARLAEQNKLTLSGFKEEVEKEGLTWTKFREEIRNEIILSQVREREVENRIFVSDNEVNEELAKEKNQGNSTPDEYDLAHILITVPENAPPTLIKERQKKIQEAMNQLNNGMPFAQAAAAYSESPDALTGGDLGWRPSTRLPTLFVEAAGKLKPGEHSEILRSPNGFHIIQVINRRTPNAIANVNQYHVRQILVRITPETNPKDAQAKIMGLSGRIQGGEDFAKLATLNSEDESRNRGGDLGWISEGSTLPQFERSSRPSSPEKSVNLSKPPWDGTSFS